MQLSLLRLFEFDRDESDFSEQKMRDPILLEASIVA